MKFALKLLFIPLVISYSAFSTPQKISNRPPTAKIIDGTRVSADSFPTVGIVRGKNGAQCTGTLITSRHVLTASHCFFDDSNQRALFDKDVTFELPNGNFSSSKVTVNPSYVSRGEACVEGETDVTIIELAQAVPGVTPSPIASSAPYLGSSARLVGYGVEGSGSFGMNGGTPKFGQVDTGLTTIEQISQSYVSWVFDPGEANTASGDSGGPAFVSNNGLSTITCGGTGNAEFGTESINTRIDTVIPWIVETAPGVVVLAPTKLEVKDHSTIVGAFSQIYLGITGRHGVFVDISTLPQGMQFDGVSISGVPTSVGAFPVDITITNSYGSAKSSFLINVTDGIPLVGATSFKVQPGKVSLTGRLPIKKGQSLYGVLVRVSMFGVDKTFRIDSKGTAKLRDGSSFSLKSKLNRGRVISNNPKFVVTYKNIADLSLSAEVPERVTVSLLGKKYSATARGV